MAVEYADAPEVSKVVKTCIEKYHPHLREAAITSLFRIGTWEKKGEEIWGETKKISGLSYYLTLVDFVIIININVWNMLNHDKREALIDERLCECGREDDEEGNPKWIKLGPDFVGFKGSIKRHGLWTPEAKQLEEIIKQKEQE